jgi:hypothetical protein
VIDMKIKVLSFFLIFLVMLSMVSGCSRKNETTSPSSSTTDTSATTITESQKPDMAAGYLAVIDYMLSKVERTKDTKILAIDTTQLGSITIEEKNKLLAGAAKYELTGVDKSLGEINAAGFWGFFYDGALIILKNAHLDNLALTLDIAYYGPYYMHGHNIEQVTITYGNNLWQITYPGNMSVE